MKKTLSVLLILSLLICPLFCGCSSGADTKAAATVTITDHLDQSVTLPSDISRIAVCDILPLPSVIAAFFNSADKIVAMSPASMTAAKNSVLSQIYPEILNADTGAIDGTEVNVEELLKLDPQVVFYNAASKELGKTLTKSGFNAVAVAVDKWDYNPVQTLNEWIALLSQIFPDSAGERARKVARYSEDKAAFVKQRVQTADKKPSMMVLLQYSDKAIVTTGQNSFGQWWADAIGATNAANELTDKNSSKVTLEQVYKWNPDVVMITNFNKFLPKDIYQNTVGNYDWSGISAAKNQKVYKMPLGLYRSYTPGADTPVTLLWLAKTVYPDLFADVDITKETVDYYKTVFDIALTNEQAQSIFAPPTQAGGGDSQRAQ